MGSRPVSGPTTRTQKMCKKHRGGTPLHYFSKTSTVLTGSSPHKIQKLSFKDHCQVVHCVLFGDLKETPTRTRLPRYTLHTANVSSRWKPRVLILNLRRFQEFQRRVFISLFTAFCTIMQEKSPVIKIPNLEVYTLDVVSTRSNGRKNV